MSNINKAGSIVTKNNFWNEGVLACQYWIKTFRGEKVKNIWKWFWGESKEVRKVHDRYVRSWRIAPLASSATIAVLGCFICIGLTWFMTYLKEIPVIGAISLYAVFLVVGWKAFLKWVPSTLFFMILSVSIVWYLISTLPWVSQDFKYGIWTDWLIKFFIKLIDFREVNDLYAYIGYSVGYWIISIGFVIMLLIDTVEKLYIWANLHYMGNSKFKRTSFYRHLVRYENRNFGWWDFTRDILGRRLRCKSPFDRSRGIMKKISSRNNDYLSAKNELIHSFQGFKLCIPKKQ